ncbi:MAG: hypothetical protein JWQ97_3631 [Phenylobacterium sp.]|nr:hypothetical protein [Phenylobacterium sp.]
MDGSTPKLVAALSNAAVAIKASVGQLCWYDIFNPSAAVAYVQLFDRAQGSVTVGTDTPAAAIGIPAGGRAQGFVQRWNFNTAITAAATTTATGSIAPATALVASFGFR